MMKKISSLGKRIRYLRKEKGLTLQEFGDLLGKKPNSLSEIENDKANVSDTLVKLITHMCDSTEQWIKTGEGDPHAGPRPKTAPASTVYPENLENDDFAMIGDLIKYYSALPPKDRKKLYAQAKNLHSKATGSPGGGGKKTSG